MTPHIKQLKRLNQVIFPVSYNDKFYKDVLEVGELAKLAYFNDIAVGAVCCRMDHSQNQKRLYIMPLGCLAPYRRLGIGTKMLNHVLNICEKDGTFDNIYLHVQISNESAIDFYRKFGFEIIETKKNYYKRIEPADAHVLQKNLKVPSGQNADVQDRQLNKLQMNFLALACRQIKERPIDSLPPFLLKLSPFLVLTFPPFKTCFPFL